MANPARQGDLRDLGGVRGLAFRFGGGLLIVAAAITAGAYIVRTRNRKAGVPPPEPLTLSFVRGPTRPDALEGWGVRWRVAALAGAGVFVFIAATLAGAYGLYEHAGAPTVTTRPAERFPAPILNARLDRDPGWSFAPSAEQIRDPDPQVRAAMQNLAAEGDAVYGPPGRRP